MIKCAKTDYAFSLAILQKAAHKKDALKRQRPRCVKTDQISPYQYIFLQYSVI